MLLRGRCRYAHVYPHHVQDGRTDEAVLDDAREEEGTGVLHHFAHDIRTATLVIVVHSFHEVAQGPFMNKVYGRGVRLGSV